MIDETFSQNELIRCPTLLDNSLLQAKDIMDQWFILDKVIINNSGKMFILDLNKETKIEATTKEIKNKLKF